jgi:hypothetical protein
MKQLLAALIFTLFALVALSSAAPAASGPPLLERVTDDIIGCVHIR